MKDLGNYSQNAVTVTRSVAQPTLNNDTSTSVIYDYSDFEIPTYPLMLDFRDYYFSPINYHWSCNRTCPTCNCWIFIFLLPKNHDKNTPVQIVAKHTKLLLGAKFANAKNVEQVL